MMGKERDQLVVIGVRPYDEEEGGFRHTVVVERRSDEIEIVIRDPSDNIIISEEDWPTIRDAVERALSFVRVNPKGR